MSAPKDALYCLARVHGISKTVCFLLPCIPCNITLYSPQEPSKKIYQCTMDGCGKQFSTPYRLKAHGRSHTGQTFSCDEDGCHKTFITPSDLNKHSRTHSGDKPFFCDYENCGKVYSTAHHLKVSF